MDFDIRIGKVKRLLIIAIGTLILFHLLGQFSAHILGHRRLFGFVEMFRMQSERNAPTYFSGVLLAWAGCLLLFISQAMAKPGGRDRGYWLALGLMFWYLSLDEVISIHENFGYYTRQMPMFSFLAYKWVVVGLLLALAVVGVFFRFWWRLEPKTRFWFAVSAGVYLGGAIGVETASGLYGKAYDEGFGFSVFIVFEEGMEMAGVAIFIVTLLGVIRDRVGSFQVRVLGSEAPSAATADAEINR